MHYLIPSDLKKRTIKESLMKIAIMQPYFLPYLGYYSLIKQADRWIFNDEVQMINKGWIQRNRILKQYGGWGYIMVPLHKHEHTEIIKNITIRNDENWKDKILAQIKHYKNGAPYFYKVYAFLENAFVKNFNSITEQNAYLIKQTCDYIGMDFDYEILSEMKLNFEQVHDPDDWSLNICKAINQNHYINPILGKQFYNVKKYDNTGIKINFLNWSCTPYKQLHNVFIDGLSIVDVMMFNSPEEINQMLDKYVLE